MNILHLYYDLMNLYGEYANVSALARYLSQQGTEANVIIASLGDSIDFSDIDFIYIGSGTEIKQLIALSDIMKYKESISDALSRGVPVLATGNSFELFGKKIISQDGTEHEALGFFDFYTEVTDKQRSLSDQVCTFSTGEKAVGFINKASQTFGVKNPAFTVDFGIGNSVNDKNEGIIEKSFFGTHLIGPLLIKNPFLAEYFVKLLCERGGMEYKGLECEYEKRAYDVTLTELTKRFKK